MAIPWHRLRPRILGLVRLVFMRDQLRRENLHGTEPEMTSRAISGNSRMGAAGARFGRNVPLSECVPDDDEALLDPSPREVSTRLLARREFIPAEILNLLAGAWIQFQVHDWFSHGANIKDRPFSIDVDSTDDDWQGTRPMLVMRTRPDDTREDGLPPVFRNTETHWWDGSQIYGSRPEIEEWIRSYSEGKLKIGDDGLLPVFTEGHPGNPDGKMTGVDITGVSGNWWIGLTLLHALFTREHNAICDMLQAENPRWDDERLFRHARLINAALMAKIHTVDWTPAILPNPIISAGVRGNWWGLLGEISVRWRRRRHEGLLRTIDLLTGVPGSLPEQHAAPYSLTEEFVSVYRMHALMPDDIEFHRIAGGRPVSKPLAGVIDASARDIFRPQEGAGQPPFTIADAFYSFGIGHPGAIRLRNFPNTLRNLHRSGGHVIDLATIDVLRDRERGVPRYNRFRELIHMPRVETFEELTGGDEELSRELADVYRGDIDKVDTMVGLYAEPLPDGFGFSETAFRIFLLMASRRLKSDPFFTSEYKPEVYTEAGIEWVEDNDMLTVLERHIPELQPALEGVSNAFQPWKKLE